MVLDVQRDCLCMQFNKITNQSATDSTRQYDSKIVKIYLLKLRSACTNKQLVKCFGCVTRRLTELSMLFVTIHDCVCNSDGTLRNVITALQYATTSATYERELQLPPTFANLFLT
jgi:hypothetical protein